VQNGRAGSGEVEISHGATEVLSPALRLGWMVVPSDFIADVARAKLHTDRGSATPEQLALADFIDSGAFDSHLRRTRQIYRRRRDALVRALHEHLPQLRLHGVAAGLHLLIELDRGVDERAVIEAAARRSIRVYGGADYRAKRLTGPPTLLVGYGGLPESTIPEAVKQLAFVLAECGQRTSSNR
jgi:GntR family transcriptional regulator / MocR family aminotransferase